MRQSIDKIRAHGLSLVLLVLGLVYSLSLLTTHSSATQRGNTPSAGRDLVGNSHHLSLMPQICEAHNRPNALGDKSRDGSGTYVDMPLVDLTAAVPELKKLTPADSQDMLPDILRQAGLAVASFFDNFPNTACTEHLTSTVQTKKSKGVIQYDHQYNYMALVEPGATVGHLKEYRATANGNPVEPDGIVTFGFVALSVNFHPEYQADSRFRYLGREMLENQYTYVVAFAQKPQVARFPASVNYLDKKGEVFLQGVAWIDPVGFRIVRLQTDIQQPEKDVGLLYETTRVLYSEEGFPRAGLKLWLPREVTVTGELQKLIFHNLHRYSDYLLFNVQVDEKLGKP